MFYLIAFILIAVGFIASLHGKRRDQEVSEKLSTEDLSQYDLVIKGTGGQALKLKEGVLYSMLGAGSENSIRLKDIEVVRVGEDEKTNVLVIPKFVHFYYEKSEREKVHELRDKIYASKE